MSQITDLTAESQSELSSCCNDVKILPKWEDLLFRNILLNYNDGPYCGTLDLLQRSIKGSAFYQGQLQNGFPEDLYGHLIYHDNTVYKGGLKQGRRNGLGMLKTRYFTIFANWQNDESDGFCLIQYKDQ